MNFTKEQCNYLESLISFEITELQNDFISNSFLLRQLITYIKLVINFNNFFLSNINSDIYISFLNQEKNIFLEQERKNISNKNFLISDEFCNELVKSKTELIKNFFYQDYQKNILIKQIIESAIFLDLYEFLIRKFDYICNQGLIKKIAYKFNDKFNLECFFPWVIEGCKNKFLYNYHHHQAIIQSNNNFSEKFLLYIVDYSEKLLNKIFKENIKNLKNIQLEYSKNYANIQNVLKSKTLIESDFCFIQNEKFIDEVQNYLNHFYLNEVVTYYNSKII